MKSPFNSKMGNTNNIYIKQYVYQNKQNDK